MDAIYKELFLFLRHSQLFYWMQFFGNLPGEGTKFKHFVQREEKMVFEKPEDTFLVKNFTLNFK